MKKSNIRSSRHTTDRARIQGQIERNEVDASADATRKIAKRIDDEGGFWGPRKEN